MQPFSVSLLLLQIMTNVCWATAQAAAALPVLIVTALLLTRKGHRSLCLQGSVRLARCMTYAALAGPFAVSGDLLMILGSYELLGAPWEMPGLLQPAVLPYTLSALLWLAGVVFSWITYRLIRKAADREKTDFFSMPYSLPGITVLIFFAAFFCLNWPFSGLPEGMSFSTAFLAVLSHTEHRFFFCLLPGGLLPLFFFPRLWKSLKHTGIQDTEKLYAERFLAGFSIAGAFPHVLSLWGTITGYLLRNDMPFPIIAKLIENSLYTITLICLVLLITNRKERWERHLQIFSCMCFLAAVLTSAVLLLQKHI